MKLVSFTAKNFRSITDAYKLPLRDFAVLVGPNNEGKSNVLRAIVTALRILSRSEIYIPQRHAVRYRYGTDEAFDYNWQRDFPVALRTDNPEGRSEFTLEFELDPSEQVDFNQAIKGNLATNLKLKLSLGRQEAKLEVLLQGKGKKQLNEHLEQIARFIAEHVDIQYIPALRPAGLAVDVVEEMLARELASLERDPKYKKLLDDLTAAQRPILQALSSELTKTVSSFVPEVTEISIETDRALRHAVRRSCMVVVNDGTSTDLAQKGDGVKSLTAISLLRHTSQKALGTKSLILAVEEPESHLHPRAIHRLREVLQEIAAAHQVIITTHSPLLVDRRDPQHNIVVQSGRAIPARRINEVREALGVQVGDNLSSARLILLVEGAEDAKILSAWLPELSQLIKAALATGDLVIDSLGGATNVRYKTSLYKNLLCNVHVFVDNDEAGRQAIQEALDAGVLLPTDYHQAVCQGMQNSEIEDFLVDASYRKVIKDTYGVELMSKFMSNNKKVWSDRVRDNFQSSGKAWGKTLERQVKITVANAAAGQGLDSLNGHRRGPIDALAQILEQRLTVGKLPEA